MAENEKDVLIGKGTTTLDWLCHNHPWLKEMVDELNRLREERISQQNDAQTLTCVYCGHQYPPGTPPSNHEALTTHIKECPKHPLAHVLKVVKNYVETAKSSQKSPFVNENGLTGKSPWAELCDLVK